MDALDQFIKRFLRMTHYIRYADDFVLLSDDKKYLISILPLMQVYLHGHLRLALHPKKVFLRTVAQGVDFLGWNHFPCHRVPRTVSKRRLFARVRVHPEDATLQSYLGMLSHGDAWELQERAKNEAWLFTANTPAAIPTRLPDRRGFR